MPYFPSNSRWIGLSYRFPELYLNLPWLETFVSLFSALSPLGRLNSSESSLSSSSNYSLLFMGSPPLLLPDLTNYLESSKPWDYWLGNLSIFGRGKGLCLSSLLFGDSSSEFKSTGRLLLPNCWALIVSLFLLGGRWVKLVLGSNSMSSSR